MVFRRIGLQIIHVDPEGNEEIEIVGGIFDPFEGFQDALCGALS